MYKRQGHALQYAEGYSPIKLRAALIPITNIGSQLAIPLVLFGFLLDLLGLVYVGIILYSTMALFQLVTLPVEFNASSRALKILDTEGILYNDCLLYTSRQDGLCPGQTGGPAGRPGDPGGGAGASAHPLGGGAGGCDHRPGDV